MRLQTLIRRLGALAVIGGLVVACTGGTTPAPTSPPTAATGSGAPASAAAKGELPKPEVTTLRFGTSAGAEMSQFAIPQAVALKLFEKYGIPTATVVGFEGEAKAGPALQAGQIDILAGGATGSIGSQLGDVPFLTVGVTATILTDDLACTSGIKSAADVKGKKLAISGFGGVSHGSALLLTKALNLTAPDVLFTVVGGQSARIAALKAGSIDCAVVDKNLSAEMKAAGLNIVASNWNPPQPFVRAGVSVTREFLQKNPNTVLVALAAILESQNMIWTDTAGATTRFAAHIQTDAAKARPNVEDFLNVGNRSLMWKDVAFVNTQKVIALANPDIIDVDLKTAYDRSLIQKLVDIGFYDKINNPARTPGG